MTFHEETTPKLEDEQTTVRPDHNVAIVRRQNTDHNAVVVVGRQNRVQMERQSTGDIRRMCEFLERRNFCCQLRWQFCWSVKLQYSWQLRGQILCWVNRREIIHNKTEDQVQDQAQGSTEHSSMITTVMPWLHPAEHSSMITTVMPWLHPAEHSSMITTVMPWLHPEVRFGFHINWQWFCCIRRDADESYQGNLYSMKVYFQMNMRMHFWVYIKHQKQLYTFKISLHFKFDFRCMISMYMPLSCAVCSNTMINRYCCINMHYWGYFRVTYWFNKKQNKRFGFRKLGLYFRFHLW